MPFLLMMPNSDRVVIVNEYLMIYYYALKSCNLKKAYFDMLIICKTIFIR